MSEPLTEATVQALEEELREATLQNNVAAHEHLLADTWLNINANGTITSKEQLLALLQTQPFTFHSIEDTDVLIRGYPGVVIVTGRSTRQRASAAGERITQVVRFTRVYAKLGEDWQVVAAQATPVIDALV
jgi:3',5'-cyclic AMP phosphodiesterase CpdA